MQVGLGGEHVGLQIGFYLGSIPNLKQASTERGLVGSRLPALGSAESTHTSPGHNLNRGDVLEKQIAINSGSKVMTSCEGLTVCPVYDV